MNQSAKIGGQASTTLFRLEKFLDNKNVLVMDRRFDVATDRAGDVQAAKGSTRFEAGSGRHRDPVNPNGELGADRAIGVLIEDFEIFVPHVE